MKADLFKKDMSSPKEKIGFEFKFETNPFDKGVLERKQKQLDQASAFLEE